MSHHLQFYFMFLCIPWLVRHISLDFIYSLNVKFSSISRLTSFVSTTRPIDVPAFYSLTCSCIIPRMKIDLVINYHRQNHFQWSTTECTHAK